MGDCMNKDIFSFVIYMIHACANKWGKYPSEEYSILSSANCIDNLLVQHYDILHTQSTNYIVEDITEYLTVRGVKI